MRIFGLALLALSISAQAAAQDATTAGEVTTPHPTLEHVSIDWAIDGDEDLDGVVTVRFRAAGAATWREGHPLFRVPAGSNEGFSWANRHSGSLFGLTPGTTYEIELTLTDPDGGSETRTASATTRTVPAIPDDATTVPVTPATFESALAAATPGQVILLGPGTYPSFTVRDDGEPGAPVVVRGEAAADVIVDGEVRMDGRHDVWILDLTLRGQIKFNDSANIVVQGCRIETAQDGIVAYGSGTRDGYFADNTVIGPTVWMESALGASGENLGEGIVLTGPGNVIANNRVERFRDCISLLEDDAAVDQRSIDILGNDLSLCADDAIEADFAMGNVRVMRNRSASTFIAWSSQPGLGGPTWFVRNVAFANFFQVFKPNRRSQGDVLYHNTVLGPGDAFGVYTSDAWGRATARNNLFVGGTGEATINGFSCGPGRVLDVSSLDTATSSFDYDGYGSIGTGRFDGRFGAARFSSLAELLAMTTEAHAVQVDLSIFAAAPTFPASVFPPVDAPDLRLADGSAAVDVGLPLPNVNDGFAGAAPDLGAYEAGSALPTYGPRGGGPICGDGVVDVGETCDDGNLAAGDGCNEDCQLEGTPGTDGGVPADGGVVPGADGGVSPGADGGTAPSGGDGCGCRAAPRPSSGFTLLLLLLALRRPWGRSSGGDGPQGGGASSRGSRIHKPGQQ